MGLEFRVEDFGNARYVPETDSETTQTPEGGSILPENVTLQGKLKPRVYELRHNEKHVAGKTIDCKFTLGSEKELSIDIASDTKPAHQLGNSLTLIANHNGKNFEITAIVSQAPLIPFHASRTGQYEGIIKANVTSITLLETKN